MTTVEFFDRSPIMNIVSSLTTLPEKIIFLGDEASMARHDPLYRSFLAQRGLSTRLEYRNICGLELDGIVEILTRIVETEPDCVFDLTGGKDLALVAMGIVYERFRDKNVRLQSFHVRCSEVCDCAADGKELYRGCPSLTVRESIQLHGGMVRGDGAQDWLLTPEFIADVHAIWAICRQDPKGWNSRMNVLASAVARKAAANDLNVALSMSKLRARAKQVKENVTNIGRLLSQLYEAGLIENYSEWGDEITYRYKDAQVKKCLEKAGTALEMEVLVTAAELTHDGAPYYQDAMCGVAIDWDGRFHSMNDEDKDTENEIDVLMMKGVIPLYVSCKNGQVEEVELYKLDTVARRFGGPVAKKALVTSRLDMKESSLAHYRQRAKDMGIKLIENACDLEPEAFRQMVKDLIAL